MESSAGARFQEVERARSCIRFKKIEGSGPDEGFVWYYKGRYHPCAVMIERVIGLVRTDEFQDAASKASERWDDW